MSNPEHDGPAGEQRRGGPQPGMVLGDTKLVRELGRGAQGVVFEGYERTLKRTVAVKILPREMMVTDEQVDRFQREAEAAGRLSHPNIVAVYGLHEADGAYYILQELVRGRGLDEALKEHASTTDTTRAGRDTEKRAATVGATLARALAHAHEHGVIHRDIKPANILVNEEGQPKITDFGLARMDDRTGLSQTGTLMGTPDYMSPEQVAARPSGIDGRTDVYSLGAMLYLMVAGQVPLRSQSLQGLLHDILTRDPKPPRKFVTGVDPDLEAVILKCLEKQPDNRYATASDLAEDLERFLAGETTVARPVSFVGRAFKSMRRLATSTLAVIAVLVPVLWLLIDLMVMRPLTAADAEAHSWRLGLVGLGALALGWPLAVLGARLVPRRLLGALGSWVLVLALAGFSSWRVLEQQADQRHLEARQALAASLNQESMGQRRSVRDLVDFAGTWSDRLDIDDLVLLARGYLLRERPQQARDWTHRLETLTDSNPVGQALVLAVHRALGESEQAELADAALWALRSHEGYTWDEWKQAGDILLDLRRYADAGEAFAIAGRLPGADRDRLNIDLAKVAGGLCRWEDMAEHVEDVLKWMETDAEANLAAVRLALGVNDFEAARRHLEVYTASPDVLRISAAEVRQEYLVESGRGLEAGAMLREMLEEHPDDPDLIQLVASDTYAQAETAMEEARSAYAVSEHLTGDQQITLAEAQYAYAEELWGRLLERDEDSLNALLGLSALSLKWAEMLPDRGDEFRARAVELAQRARDRQPEYWRAHYNLALSRLRVGLATYQGFDAMPDGELESFVETVGDGLARHGLQAQALNDAAYVLGTKLYPRTGDRSRLEEALAMARRACERSRSPFEGECPGQLPEREAHSSHQDTLRELLELAGDDEGALAAAEAAAHILPSDHPRRPARDAAVEALRQRLGRG